MTLETTQLRRAALLSLALLLTLSACATAARRQAPQLTSLDAVPTGFPREVMYVDDGRQDHAGEATRLLWKIRQSAAGGHINVLALSGGGSGIAFGAGALVGWTRSGTRPEFQIVTGVSAGALLAPLAFLGPGWDHTVTEAFSGAQTQHLLQSRWIRALFGASVYRGEPLVELVDRYVSDNMLRAVAAESARGRLLLVATTDLDHERTVIWDMGRIAAEGGDRGRRLFRDVLVASASVPGVFPPVMIRVREEGIEFDEMHVDGGTTSPFFIAPASAPMSQEALQALEGASVYVIVNGQLGGTTLTTPVRTVSIVRRGVDAALESSSRAAVEVALSVSNQAEMTLRVSEIPDDYPYTGWLDMGRANMGALFDFGQRCAMENGLWDSASHALSRAKHASFAPPGGPASCPAPAVVAVASAGGVSP
jgi:predicted acylesterase/phospholipase RssA